jgi:hypothetical protein
MKITIKTYGMLLITLIVSLAFLPASAEGQGTQDRELVRSALERTDEILTEARTIVADSRSQKGLVKLQAAVDIQRKAWDSFTSQSNLMAMNLTRNARQEAFDAIALARADVQAQERLKRIYEETVERIARVRDMMAESGVLADQPMKLLNESRDLLEKSRLNFNQYRYQLALKLAELARSRAVTAEQQVRTIRAIKETVERRLEMLARLMERAREYVQQSNDDRARQQLRFAEEQYLRALELLRNGRYHAARSMMENVEKALRSLIRQFSSRSRLDPEAMLDEAYRLLARAVQMTSGAEEGDGALRSQEMIEQARRLLNKAEESIAAGQPDEARRLIEQARNLLRRAIAEGREQPDDSAVAAMIENLERYREEVLSTFSGCEAPGIGTLIERADARLAAARSKLGEGDLSSAEAEARIARNLYDRIREVCSM